MVEKPRTPFHWDIFPVLRFSSFCEELEKFVASPSAPLRTAEGDVGPPPPPLAFAIAHATLDSVGRRSCCLVGHGFILAGKQYTLNHNY